MHLLCFQTKPTKRSQNFTVWTKPSSCFLLLSPHSSDGPALLPSTLRLWTRERRRAGLQRGRHHHPDQPDRRQLVRGHDQRPVGLLPHQLRGYPGAAPSLGPAIDLTLPPHQSRHPENSLYLRKTTYRALLLLLLLCFCAILLSQTGPKRLQRRRRGGGRGEAAGRRLDEKGILAWEVQKRGRREGLKGTRRRSDDGLLQHSAHSAALRSAGQRRIPMRLWRLDPIWHRVYVRACMCLYVRFNLFFLYYDQASTNSCSSVKLPDSFFVILSSSLLQFLAVFLLKHFCLFYLDLPSCASLQIPQHFLSFFVPSLVG